MTVDELVVILGYKIEGEADLKRYGKGMDSLQKKASKLAKDLERAGKVAGVALATGFLALGRSVINTSAKFETYLTTLETIEGSAEKAKSSFDWITRFAVKTPFEMDELTQAFVRLKAYGLDPTDGTMETLGDTASAMGVSLMQAVEMFADASTMEFERLKGFGIKAKQKGEEVTFTWSKNGKEMTKTLKKNSEEVRKFLLDNFGSRFNGAMVRQSKTWAGMMSNLGDSWTMFLHRIGEGGFFDTVKEHLAGLLDKILEWDENGTLDKWSQRLSNAFTAAANAISIFAEAFGRHWEYLSDKFDGASAHITPFMAALKALGLVVAARLFPITFWLGVAALAIDDFLTYLQGGESVIGDFINALAEFLGAEPETVAAALGGIAQAAMWLAVAAVGVGMFSKAIRALAGALVLLKGLGWAVGLLKGLGKAGASAGAGAAGVAAAKTFAKTALKAIPGIGTALAVMDPTEMADGTRVSEDDWADMMERAGSRNKSAGSALSRMGGGGSAGNGQGALATALQNKDVLARALANMSGLSPSKSQAAVQQDARAINDNRQFPFNTTINVGGVNVAGESSAPGALGRSIGNAAASAVNQQRARITSTPTTSGNGPL